MIFGCSSIFEDREPCPNYLCLHSLYSPSYIQYFETIDYVDSVAYDLPHYEDTVKLTVTSSIGSNSEIVDEQILIKDLSKNADSLYYYSRTYDFTNIRQIDDSIQYTPLYLVFNINIKSQTAPGDIVFFNIHSQNVGIEPSGEAIKGHHTIYDIKNTIVLRPQNTFLYLNITVKNPSFPDEKFKFDLTKFLVEQKVEYNVDVNLSTGQLIII